MSVDRCLRCGTTLLSVDGPAAAETEASAGWLRWHLATALGDLWEVGHLLGRGGFAEVYVVRDRRLQRDVAVKVMHPSLAQDPQAFERFHREALVLARLRHPHVVPVFDRGEYAELAYLVMPLVSGRTLADAIGADGALPLPECARIVSQAAAALHAVHAADVVHRDVKPENVMLEGPDGHVLLLDFGIAKSTAATEISLTASGLVVGTPAYMSPEQLAGERVDHRSDQYSLATVAYRMVTGHLPFEGAGPPEAVALRRLLEEPPPASRHRPELPASADSVLHRALGGDPGRRFDSVLEFARAFAQALAPDVPGRARGSSDEPAHRAGPRLALEAADGSVARVHRLDPTRPTIVGRGRHCDVRLPQDDERASRRHCMLRPSTDGFVLDDLGSRYGTLVNDRRVEHTVLAVGDRVRCSRSVFRLLGTAGGERGSDDG